MVHCTVAFAPPPFDFTDQLTLEQEVAPYRAMSVEERGQLLAAACRASARMLRSRPDRERVLSLRDPVPESTRLALVRLRKSEG